MKYITLINQDIKDLNKLIDQNDNRNNIDKTKHLINLLNQLISNISIHTNLIEQEVQNLQQQNEEAIKKRNGMNGEKLDFEAKNRELIAERKGILSTKKDLEKDIQTNENRIINLKKEISVFQWKDREQRKAINNMPLFGWFFEHLGLTEALLEITKALTGATAKLHSNLDETANLMQQKKKNMNAYHTCETDINELTKKIITLKIELHDLEILITGYDRQLLLLSQEIVLMKELIHGLKSAIIELEAAKDKTSDALHKFLKSIMQKKRLKKVKIEDKAIYSLSEAFNFLEKAIEHITPKAETARRRITTAPMIESQHTSTYSIFLKAALT